MANAEKKKKKLKGISLVKNENKVVEVDQDDYLIRQIDLFKNKAAELQDKLNDREAKYQELEATVDVKEQEARELQAVVDARAQEADNVLRTTEAQMRNLTYAVEAKINDLASIIQDKVDNNEQITADQTAKLEWEFKQLESRLDKIKADLSDKTHQENLSSYRNVSASLKEVEENLTKNLAETTLKEESVKKISMPAIGAFVFSALNFVCLIAYILYDMGVFK
jgi:chromosome segregation ATPase